MEIIPNRKDYSLACLNIEDISQQPLDQFSKWYLDASTNIHDDVNAMALAGLPLSYK